MGNESEIKLEGKLSELLTECGVNSSDIAQEIGVSPALISQYRTGETQPSVEKLVALARALDVSLDYLVLGESAETDEVEVEPIAEYMIEKLQETQKRHVNRSAIVSHTGEILSQKLDEEIGEMLETTSSRHLYTGIVTDLETDALEKHSELTRLVLRDFSYNMSQTETPGSFFTTVANNLSQGREYQYLLPESDSKNWSSLVRTFRSLLIEQTKSETAVRSNCRFKTTTAPLLLGCGFYHLAEEELEDEDPELYEYVHKHNYITEGGWFGYITSPSLTGRGEPVMDRPNLINAIAIFESLWDEADPI